MGPDVHRDPDMLRLHAVAAHDLADELQAALPGMARADDCTDAERATLTIRRAVAELRDLAADLARAAEIEHADSDAFAALRRALMS